MCNFAGIRDVLNKVAKREICPPCAGPELVLNDNNRYNAMRTVRCTRHVRIVTLAIQRRAQFPLHDYLGKLNDYQLAAFLEEAERTPVPKQWVPYV